MTSAHRHYHLIGLLGASLSGIANLLRAEGHVVTGSDERTTGHGADRLPAELDVVIYSEAVTPGSAGWPELEAARARGVPCLRRIEFIAARMAGRTGVAVAGAHGKSTTTALIGWILAEAGADPTVFIGADLPAFGGSGRAGKGRFVVTEACEWNRQFLALHPTVLVMTNIDREHLDTYPGGEAEIIANFHQLASQVQTDGLIVANGDDPLVRTALDDAPAPIRWVGRSDGSSDQITAVDQTPTGQLQITVNLQHAGPKVLISPLVGDHQAINSVLAVTATQHVGVSLEIASQALRTFPGLNRRFERVRDDAVLTVVDDYAHHPTELGATLRAARARYPGRRLVAAFQPHLSERTTDLFDRFVAALSLADRTLVLDTYEPAGRHVRPDAKQSPELAAAISARGGSAAASGTVAATETALRAELRSGDVLLTLGAGHANQLDEPFRIWAPDLVDSSL